ncbi:lactate dehydrogenase-like 2-hydroxyacid dehydrogenase [Bartonella silvatica]|uniref:Lactate dehydrogenase-like 2-hydroxyacid dehydrogenase n=1 Tax=Bartonella silvatica TaxID=357760 RepID=A0ABV2HG57_9HYPH
MLVINNLAKNLEDKPKEIDTLILIREQTIVDKHLLLKLPNLKLICQTTPIGSHIDIEPCRNLENEILGGASNPTSTAELVLLLIISAHRKLCKSVSDMKKGRWQITFGVERIGEMASQYAQAFSMSILGYGSKRLTQKVKNFSYYFTHS